MSRGAAADAQGGAFGLAQSAGSRARTFGPTVAGALYVGVGAWAPFAVGGSLVLPVAAMLRRPAADPAGGVSDPDAPR